MYKLLIYKHIKFGHDKWLEWDLITLITLMTNQILKNVIMR